MSDDTPTQRFDQQPATPIAPTAPTTTEQQEPKKRGPLVPILIAVGALLLIGVLVLGSLLLFRPVNHTPVAADTAIATQTSATPVPIPTVTVTVTPAPVTNSGGSSGGGGTSQKPNGSNVLITGYSISPSTVDCGSGAPAGSTDLHISWKSVNGDEAFFGVETPDAQAAGEGWTLPSSGDQHDFPSGFDPFTYVCGDSQQHFTITVVGNGSKQSLTFTVHRK